jgi:hypothetical protein
MAGGATCPDITRINLASPTRRTVNLEVVEYPGEVVALERYETALTARGSGYPTSMLP